MELAPKQTGLSTARLERITDHLERNYIAPGKIAGCQVAVARHGHLAYFRSLGQMDRERAKPMADDAIFRIYSMTKPITSVALMSLYERGYFQLNDPVSRFFPAWRDHRVWVSGRGAAWRPRRRTARSACATCSATPAASPTARRWRRSARPTTATRSTRPTPRVGVRRGEGETLMRVHGQARPRCRCAISPASAGCIRSPPTSAARWSRRSPASGSTSTSQEDDLRPAAA